MRGPFNLQVFSPFRQAEAERTGHLFLESEQVWQLDLAIATYIVAFARAGH